MSRMPANGAFAGHAGGVGHRIGTLRGWTADRSARNGRRMVMDAGLLHGLWTAAMIAVFVAIVAWAWSGRRKRDFEEAARLAAGGGGPGGAGRDGPTARGEPAMGNFSEGFWNIFIVVCTLGGIVWLYLLTRRTWEPAGRPGAARSRRRSTCGTRTSPS